jgi:ABC-2 type transport system permease protein
MELRLLLRNGENLLVTFAIPVAALGMAAALPALPASEQPPGQLVGGALAVAVFAAAFVALPITTAFARDANVLKRLGVSPLSRGDLVAAKLVALALVVAGQVALVVITGVAIGWGGPPEPAAAAVALLIVVPLLAAGAAGVGLALAGRLPPMRVLAVVNVVFVFALLNSGLVVPVGELPVWLQTPALALPVAPATSALAWLLTPGAQPVLSWSVTAPPLMVWGLGGPLAAVALFCWWDE